MRSCCTIFTRSRALGNDGIGVTMTGCCNNVDSATVSGNGFGGVVSTGCDTDRNLVVNSRVNGNGAQGVSVLCPSSVVNLKAKGNVGANLEQLGGTCTTAGVKAP